MYVLYAFNAEQWSAQGGLIGLIVLALLSLLVMFHRTTSRNNKETRDYIREYTKMFMDDAKRRDKQSREERAEARESHERSLNGLSKALEDLSKSLKQ